MVKASAQMSSRERLIQRYEQIIEEEVFSDDEKGISIPILRGVQQALQEGLEPDHFEEERDINRQHMGQAYFRRIRWTWDRAIRATQRDLVNKGASSCRMPLKQAIESTPYAGAALETAFPLLDDDFSHLLSYVYGTHVRQTELHFHFTDAYTGRV